MLHQWFTCVHLLDTYLANLTEVFQLSFTTHQFPSEQHKVVCNQHLHAECGGSATISLEVTTEIHQYSQYQTSFCLRTHFRLQRYCYGVYFYSHLHLFSWTRDFWQNSTENSICFHDHPGESHWYHFRSHSNGGLHSNFLIGIANIDSLPTVTMILSISLSLPCPISRSQVFTLQNYDKRKPASTTWRLFLIFV